MHPYVKCSLSEYELQNNPQEDQPVSMICSTIVQISLFWKRQFTNNYAKLYLIPSSEEAT